MEKQRSLAIEALEISSDYVKCQKCSMDIPIVGKLARPHNDRVAILQKRIRWMENYYHGNRSNANDLKLLKAELAELLEEDAKTNLLRCLPLYSCRITGWKFVCSRCYDKVYLHTSVKRQSSTIIFQCNWNFELVFAIYKLVIANNY
jgi:hypothetical protein